MWKQALNKFIKKYQKDQNVEAILLVGSYAVGNNNKYSDIDVYIILDNNAKYQERGNKLIDGYLIEYFINPYDKVIKYLQEDQKKHRFVMANMLLNCQIIIDKNNIMPKLKKEAKYYNEIKQQKDKLKYYACWCAYDEYKAAPYHNKMPYYLCLKYLIEAYLYHNGYHLLPELKIEKFFKDKIYRQKYNINHFPNNKFNKLVINCFDKPNKINLNKLYEYVIKNGQFNINNFKIRNEIE